jgi:superfamily II DNA or RNA helicase
MPSVRALPGSFAYLEQKLRTLESAQGAGSAFERLCKQFLSNAPQYKSRIKRVWLWREWPGRRTADKGIDLIAETFQGELWAVQAKFFSPNRAVPKAEVDSFLSESNRPEFSFRLLIATTDDIGRNALDTIRAQEKPVGLVLRGELLQTEIKWPSELSESLAPLPRKAPRRHQREAIAKVCAGLARHDRGRLTMACGTGKTLTALWIAERLKSRRTLVLVPSLSLITQILNEWGRNAARPFDSLVVCSDETVVQRGEDHAVSSTRELGVPVTTKAREIGTFLSQTRNDRPAVVFCTYQSSDCIAAAQETNSAAFDLALADEAHRCTGHAGSLFTTVLDGGKIKARKRLFMTATPRYFTGWVKKIAEEREYELASMDDEKLFGPELHRLNFGSAIRQDLLTDYRVVVIGVTKAEVKKLVDEGRLLRVKGDVRTDARTLASQVGLAKAIRKYNLRKVITFHSSVERASRFTDENIPDSLRGAIERMSARPTGKLWMGHISGKTPAGRRATLLNVFRQLDGGTRGVLSNCACLSEGVDVPSLDCVAFLDPKRSMIDIIQAVGRAIRKAPDKRLGTVVIPVFVDESTDADHALNESAFEPVWQVLKALRAHDSELAEELDGLRLKLGRRLGYRDKLRLPAKIHVDIPTLVPKDFERSFYVRTVERTTAKPQLTEKEILAWADSHHNRAGKWPVVTSGLVNEAPGESWQAIHLALAKGLRGLPGGSSLARLLTKYRGARNIQDLPELSIKEVLLWADQHKRRTGRWPQKEGSGEVKDAPGESWTAINSALRMGLRGLPGGSSLARLLTEHRGVRNVQNLPSLSTKQILKWADSQHANTGKWPKKESGRVKEVPHESWSAINAALSLGLRGLPGGSSLAQFLTKHRSVRNMGELPPLSTRRILKWADMHKRRTGEWPTVKAGHVQEALDENWNAIDAALRAGRRSLPRGSSLARLLAEHRGARNLGEAPPLSTQQILEWADTHHKRTGKWPVAKAGAVVGSSGEGWQAINLALTRGLRGLRGGSSLAKLLAKHRGIRKWKATAT